MKDWTDDYRQLIEDCEARESRLSDWERNFLDSIGKQLDKGIALSQKQINALDATWERATAKG